MKKSVLSTLILSAVLCLGGCGKSKDNSSSEKNSQKIETTAADSSGIITPDKDSEEYDLGSYRISSNGIKLYYEDSEYPPELIETLEKYFLSFSTGDFASYKECIFPSYIETIWAEALKSPG